MQALDVENASDLRLTIADFLHTEEVSNVLYFVLILPCADDRGDRNGSSLVARSIHSRTPCAMATPRSDKRWKHSAHIVSITYSW